MNDTKPKPQLSDIPKPPEGVKFRLNRITTICIPHPFCITTAHFPKDGGMYIKPEQAPCGMRGCQLRHDEHKSQLALEIAVRENRDLNAIEGLNAYLLSIKEQATALGIEGFAFPTEQQIEARKQRAYVKTGGCGGFLNPPGHPEHNFHVSDGHGSMLALSTVLDEPENWKDDSVRTIRSYIEKWEKEKPAISAPEVQDWIHHVLGYFRGCYKGDGPEPECWHADKLKIDKERDPVEHADEHAGVRTIRKYYPEYQPNALDFAEAYWGTKPSPETAKRR